MGLLVEGVWHDQWYDTESTKGVFVRSVSQFRHWVTADGAAGQSGQDGFKAAAGRYHLYVSLACPWAHRTLIFRKLKKLEDVISVSVVHPYMLEQGWSFDHNANDGFDHSVDRDDDNDGDVLNGCDYLHQIYTLADPKYSGRVTVPILWDKETRTIVNNESADIIRMFNTSFSAFTDVDYDFCPQDLCAEIDAVNEFIYGRINNGVYKCGFATQQAPYEAAYDELFSALDRVEECLGQQRYLLGDQVTEADWRLFSTLARFDAVYYSHFKCNKKQIEDYSNISNYYRDLYQQPGIAHTVNMTHIKQHYYYSQSTINPTRIVPKGPDLNYMRPHDRDRSYKNDGNTGERYLWR